MGSGIVPDHGRLSDAAVRIVIAGTVHVSSLQSRLDDLDGLGDGERPADSTPGTQLVEELLQRGHQVGVGMMLSGITRRHVATGPGLTIMADPQRDQGRGRDAFRLERRALVDQIRVLAPQVVHAQWTYEYALAALSSGLPTVVTMRDWAPSVLRLWPDPHRLVRFVMNAVVVARAPCLTVTSPMMRDRLRRVRQRGVHLVPNGLRDQDFAAVPRLALGSPSRIISVSNGFSAMKNTATLLQAMVLVRRRHPDAVLEMLGVDHGPDGPAQRWAEQQEVADGVVFSGHLSREEVVRRVDGADVLAHPAREEPFGMAVVEAMGRGVPVVGGRRSGALPWLLDDGRAGILVDVGDPASVASGVLSLLDDPHRWQAVSRAAWERASSTFRLQRSVDHYIALYHQALCRAPT